jgi:Fe-S cluster biogenesis protein NfuA
MVNTIEPTPSRFGGSTETAAPDRPQATPDGASPADRIQELLHGIEELPDPRARDLAEECLRSLLELYGDALARILGLCDQAGPAGGPLREALVQDKLISSLLLIHGLHPRPLEERLREALEKVRPYMQSHGGNVELAKLEDGIAHLRFHGACQSCRSSAVTMELAIRRAVEETCPDLLGLELDANPAERTYVSGHSR